MNKNYRVLLIVICTISISAGSAYAQKKATSPTEAVKAMALNDLQLQYDFYRNTELQIWNYAEVGYKEYKSSRLLQQVLRDNDFTVDSGVADIPTAFVATYGSGKPVIGILAEYDALPGLSQDASPEKHPRP